MAIEEKMLELANRLPPSERRDRPLPDSVRAFLVESERRVLLHCRKLLAQENLSGDERRKLVRLAGEAEEELQRLAA
jgi:hypothetical protein